MTYTIVTAFQVGGCDDTWAFVLSEQVDTKPFVHHMFDRPVLFTTAVLLTCQTPFFLSGIRQIDKVEVSLEQHDCLKLVNSEVLPFFTMVQSIPFVQSLYGYPK